MVPLATKPEQVDILIAEDSPTQAQQLTLLLQSQGYRVRVTQDGEQALAEIRRARPTLVISDIMMPGMDGYTLCKTVKEDETLRTIPVILVTSLTTIHDVIKGLDCGADNFIRKPYEERYLLGRIRFILANQELRKIERVQLGLQVNISGRQYFVNTERQQIFDLLISTYEEAITMTEELNERQAQISRSYQSLESLYRVTEGLNPALTEEEVARNALERALELPGVLGGCIGVVDIHGDGSIRLLTSQDYPNAIFPDLSATTVGTRVAVSKEPEEDWHQILIPLWAGPKLLGLMKLRCMGNGNRNDADLKVFETVGNHVAIALERAHLYMNLDALVKRRTQALEAERNLLTTVINTASALVMLLDAQGRIVRFNPACEQAFGWKAAEVEGRGIEETLLQNVEPHLVDLFFQNTQSGAKPQQFQTRLDVKDGTIRDVLWSVSSRSNTPEGEAYIVATGLDVTELRSAEEQVRYLSNYDSLTGLPNRLLFRERFQRESQRVKGESSVVGVLAVYLSRLAMIGDTFGASAKDNVIQEAALRLKSICGHADTVARLGDYSFAVIAVQNNVDNLATTADKILAALDQPYHLDDTELHVGPRIGITLFPTDGEKFDDLVQAAEAAAHQLQPGGDLRRKFYTPELNQGATERIRLEGSLRRAIEREEFTLHYQPQVSLESGEIIGFEALIRWNHPELGMVPPTRFIPIAEETGLVAPIGDWVLRTACRQFVAWQQQGLPPVPVAVNLSAKQFVPGLEKKVQAVLEETGLEAKYLELELTEHSSMEDPEATIQLLKQLRALGVCISIDDFGTGYSSLNYLKRFPINKLKIDRAFVKDVTSDPDDLAITRTVIGLAQRLRLKVIAEGVETEGQLALLAEHGCDEIQGYLYSRPLPPEACVELLSNPRILPLPKKKPYRRTLLLVDGEASVITSMSQLLDAKGYDLLTAAEPETAFELLATHEVGVILCDQRMLGVSGTEFYARVRHMYPNIVRMILSGYTDLKTLADAVNKGSIFKFLEKPWNDEEVSIAVEEAFQHYESRSIRPNLH